jgi:hypothetical protein
MDLENRLNAELDGLLKMEKEVMKALRALKKAESSYEHVLKAFNNQQKNIRLTEKMLLTQINGQKKINNVYSDYQLKRRALGLNT